jgi:hypothetical protein
VNKNFFDVLLSNTVFLRQFFNDITKPY